VDRRCMKWRRVALLLPIIVVLGALLHPPIALATSPLPGEPCVELGFHASYQVGDESFTHHGVDLLGLAGDQVAAPVAGTVSFVGSVPASETGDEATMLALSLLLDDGRVLSLMPLASTWVQEGDVVSVGEPLGTLAGSGDRSCAKVHLHVGLRAEGRYLDPLPLLMGVASATTDGTNSGLSEEGSIAVMPEPMKGAGEGVSAERFSSGDPLPESPSAGFGTISSGGVDTLPVGAPASVITSQRSRLLQDAAEALREAGIVLRGSTIVPRRATPMLLLVLAPVCAGAVVAAVRTRERSTASMPSARKEVLREV